MWKLRICILVDSPHTAYMCGLLHTREISSMTFCLYTWAVWWSCRGGLWEAHRLNLRTDFLLNNQWIYFVYPFSLTQPGFCLRNDRHFIQQPGINCFTICEEFTLFSDCTRSCIPHLSHKQPFTFHCLFHVLILSRSHNLSISLFISPSLSTSIHLSLFSLLSVYLFMHRRFLFSLVLLFQSISFLPWSTFLWRVLGKHCHSQGCICLCERACPGGVASKKPSFAQVAPAQYCKCH